MEPADLAVTAESLRAVLAEIADDGSEVTASAATRHRIEGAALVLDALGRDPGSEEWS